MDKWEKEMFAEINRNHDLRAMANKLNAISARRKNKRVKR